MSGKDREPDSVMSDSIQKIKLPEPVYDSNISIEEAIMQRRSVRVYTGDSLSLDEAGQLLWAAQGITNSKGNRSAPSAGGLYPIEIYLVSERIKNLDVGAYHYLPDEHSLEKKVDGELLTRFYFAAMMQASVKRASAIIVITAVYKRTTKKYGARGERYVHVEAGHVAQNICLQSVSLDLGTVTVGAFRDSVVSEILQLSKGEFPLYLLPVGKKPEK